MSRVLTLRQFWKRQWLRQRQAASTPTGKLGELGFPVSGIPGFRDSRFPGFPVSLPLVARVSARDAVLLLPADNSIN